MATVVAQAILGSGIADVFCSARMTPALSAPLALDYLHELSTDVRAGVVLAADGALLAGRPELAGPARGLLAAAGDAAEVRVALPAGAVYAVRSSRHAVVLACGPLALAALALHDLRVVLAELDGRREAA
jgi:hypothetical protein